MLTSIRCWQEYSPFLLLLLELNVALSRPKNSKTKPSAQPSTKSSVKSSTKDFYQTWTNLPKIVAYLSLLRWSHALHPNIFVTQGLIPRFETLGQFFTIPLFSAEKLQSARGKGHIRSFRNLGQLFKFSTKKIKILKTPAQGASGGLRIFLGVNISFLCENKPSVKFQNSN